MKNKLITRSALAGSLMLLGVSSVANAQTTVTGNLTISYKAIGNERAAERLLFDASHIGRPSRALR